jgi:hypothetical protein
LLGGEWIRRILGKGKETKRERKPVALKQESERDCPFCVNDKGKLYSSQKEMPVAWRLRKGRDGPKKILSTRGYFCPNVNCKYYGISDESLHTLIGYGCHGK